MPDYQKMYTLLFNAATDALLFTQTLCNLMDEEGLGYCYLGTTVYMPQMIIDTLQLPKLVMPVATLTAQVLHWMGLLSLLLIMMLLSLALKPTTPSTTHSPLVSWRSSLPDLSKR